MIETLLVTGIHRQELAFGDRVAALLEPPDQIQVMRIPEGISRTRSGADGLFYDNTRHREIYLQLLQQIKERYRLLIDLHCGVNDSGRCADIYCRERPLMQCIAKMFPLRGVAEQLRMIRILTDTEVSYPAHCSYGGDIGARTSIPEQLWNGQNFTYVGLEIYLAQEGEGVADDWRFAHQLIKRLQVCVKRE